MSGVDWSNPEEWRRWYGGKPTKKEPLKFEFEGKLDIHYPWGSDNLLLSMGDVYDVLLDLYIDLKESFPKDSFGEWRVTFEKVEDDE